MNYSRCSLFFLLTLSLFLFSQEKAGLLSRVVMRDGVIDYSAIEELFPEPLFLEHVHYESDVYMQKEEFFYALGFKQNAIVCCADITRATEYFVKKNKYVSIAIDLISSAAGTGLIMHFEGMWTCNKVKIYGVFRGKHLFVQQYAMEPGAFFDKAHHEHSVAKIKELLKQEGHYQATVTSLLDYNETTKEVTVRITINKGKRFYFNDVGVVLSAQDGDAYTGKKAQIEKKAAYGLRTKPARKILLDQKAVELKSLCAQHGFLHPSITAEQMINRSQGTVDVQFMIDLHGQSDFVFMGNHFFSHKQLLQILLEFGRSVWLMPPSLLAQEIIRAYKAKGFWQVEVAVQEEKKRSFFIIKEGARALVKKVSIQRSGEKPAEIDDEYTIKSCFKRLLRRKVYDALLFDQAMAALYSLYAKAGFLTCSVTEHHWELRSQLKGFDEYELLIMIDEQQSVHVASVSVEAMNIDTNSQLSLQTGAKAEFSACLNTALNESVFDVQRTWLVDYFQKRGYLHPRLKPTVDIRDGAAAITWHVDAGEQARFGKTVIAGSSTFPFEYLLASLRYVEGELWDQTKVHQTCVRLKELEIFDSITLVPDHTSTDETKPILLKVREDDRYELRTRAGFELQHIRKYQTFNGVTYKIGTTALIKNPFNCGDQIRFDCDLAHSHKEIVGQYRRPWFLRVPFVSLFQAYIISYKQPGFIGSTNDIYMLKQRGFFAGIQRKTYKADLGLKAGFEWMSTTVKDEEMALEVARAIDFEPQLLDQFVPFFFIEPGIVLEHLDNPFNPSRGTATVLSLKAMVPMKDKYQNAGFVKALIEQSFFVPCGKMVCALRIRLGHIFRRGLRAIMPSERFFLGGSHSLRGYEADLAPPLGVFVNQDCHEHIVPKGGRSMFNANFELRIPLFRAIGGVLFQDIGALSGDRFADFELKKILAATGFGARFFTPLGPLRFDIGWRWTKQLQIERSFAWYLTFGHAF